jgi:hypothetical protein
MSWGLIFFCRISFCLVITIFWYCSHVQLIRYPVFFLEIGYFGDWLFWRLAFHLTVKGNLKTGPSLTDHPTPARPSQLCSPSPSQSA